MSFLLRSFALLPSILIVSVVCFFVYLRELTETPKGTHLSARESFVAQPADEDEDERGPQGIPTTFRSLVTGTTSATDIRLSRLVALYVPAGQSATPFLPPGPFQATFQGKIPLDLAGEYTLSAEGRGSLKISVNGEVVLEGSGNDFRTFKGKPFRLKRKNELLAVYESPKEGDAQLRVFWESEEFRRETLHWKYLRHDPENMALAHAKSLREGRELIATQRCTKCHFADTDAWIKAGGMPELAMDAPALDEIGSRLQAPWLARWIQHPASLRPTATMPQVLPDMETEPDSKLDPRARDMAAYLASLGKVPLATKAADEETIQEGTRLFTYLGCIACHMPPSQEQFEDDKKRIPLRDMNAKWHPAALRTFLKQPEKHYRWIRMPNFNLSDVETQRLAAFLLNTEKRPIFEELKDADLENGKKLVQSSGCLNCHSLTGEKSTLKVSSFAELPKKSWSGGCVEENGEKPRKAPVLNLEKSQLTSIKEFCKDERNALAQDNPTEFAQRQMNLLRCYACHTRGAQIDYWTKLKEEENGLLAGLPPLDPENVPKYFLADQTRPTLTWTGEKLRAEWLVELFSGKLDYKPRPYLRARMPAFPQRATWLAHGLAFEHGCSPKSDPLPPLNPKLADIGRELASKKRWACASCHDVGKTAAVGVFETPGPNFMYVRERIRREFFEGWLWAPLRLEPSTKMPTPYFWGQPSQIKDILEGDPSKQIGAFWHYMLSGRDIRPPGE